jgi:hypothetical protein
VLGRAARGHFFVEDVGIVVVESVSGDGRRVHEPSNVAAEASLEDVARSLHVDLSCLLGVPQDDEGQVDHNVCSLDQVVDAAAIGHVALAILELRPSGVRGIERPARHPDDPVDAGLLLQRVDE